MSKPNLPLGLENAERLLDAAAHPTADYRENMLDNAEQAVAWCERNGAPPERVQALRKKLRKARAA